MAGDWIKMRGNLWDDPRVARLCDATDQPESMVVGALYWLWATADQHTSDGIMPGLSLRQIDRKTGIAGFGQALCDINWLEDRTDGVVVLNFEEHNGQSAKRRATDAQRKANVRSVSAEEADKTKTALGAVAELEEEREEEVLTATAESGDSPQSCPTQKIIELFKNFAPSLTQPRIVTDATKQTISARWRQAAKHQSLDFWKQFFSHCNANDFLAGRGSGRNGGKPFRAGLEWIVKAENFAKIINGNYENDRT